METAGGDVSCLNVNKKRQNRSIHNTLRLGLIDINQLEKKRCCAAENYQRYIDA